VNDKMKTAEALSAEMLELAHDYETWIGWHVAPIDRNEGIWLSAQTLTRGLRNHAVMLQDAFASV
jgi:hypothetical protein